MEVNDLQSGRDLNFRVELTKLDLCAKFQLPSFNRDFRAGTGFKFHLEILTERNPPFDEKTPTPTINLKIGKL